MKWLKKIWQERPRWSQLFLVNVIYVLLVILPLYCYFAPLDKDLLKGAGIWNFFTLILAIPSVFMVWYFRDQNSKETLENQRKDTNLKDFQKLSELAAGQYLAENEIITETKGDDITTKKTETSLNLENASIISKNTGSYALQVAAIYQIKAFLDGEHGQYFKHPTFQLLTTLWRVFLLENLKKNKKIEAIPDITKSVLAKAIQNVLLADNGRVLHENKNALKGIVLAGMNLQGLDFENLDLKNSRLDYAKCQLANFQNTKLIGAELRYADFSNANLKGAKIHNLKEIKNAIFTDAVCDDTTEVYVHVDGKVKKEETLELRNQLKAQGLILSEEAYILEKIPDNIKL